MTLFFYNFDLNLFSYICILNNKNIFCLIDSKFYLLSRFISLYINSTVIKLNIQVDDFFLDLLSIFGDINCKLFNNLLIKKKRFHLC